MTRRELLQERYEDALFALLMDEIATEEGKKAEAENERLKNDPSAAIPEALDKRCTQTIRRAFAKQRVRSVGRFTVKAMKRVALAAGIAAILFTTAFATSETVRVHVLNLAIEVFETNTEFRFSDPSEQTALQFSVGWVPNDFVLTEQASTSLEIWYDYQSAEDALLSISCKKTDGLVAGIDTESAEIEYIPVQDSQAMLVRKDGTVQLVWTSRDNAIFISIWGRGIDQEDVIHIANELTY